MQQRYWQLEGGCSSAYWQLESGCWRLESGCSSAYWQLERGCISGYWRLESAVVLLEVAKQLEGDGGRTKAVGAELAVILENGGERGEVATPPSGVGRPWGTEAGPKWRAMICLGAHGLVKPVPLATKCA